MSLVTLTGLLASISGVVMALSPLLQARRVHEIRDSSEVSQAFVCVLIGNACVWMVHGVVTSDVVIFLPNVVTLVAASVTLLVVRRYRDGGHAPTEAEPASEPDATGDPAHTGELARVHRGAGSAAARARRAVSLTRR
ncbi:MAG TPA: SemiSWEET family transporter [Conexibacter sp.]|nr:SemiSWEET family transporter [Conexibacter sp.]